MNKRLGTLYLIGFFMALAEAFPGYIRSTYLEEFVEVRWVGAFFIGSALLSIMIINFFPIFIKRWTNYQLSLIILSLAIVSYVTLALTYSVAVAFTAFIVSGTAIILFSINLDVFVERFTANPTTGRIRTIYMTFLNLGWLVSPLTVGHLIGQDNYRLIYLIASLFMAIALVVLVSKKDTLADHVRYQHHHSLATIKNIWKRMELRGIFAIAFLLQLFYAVAVIYIPIYLHENIGFSWLTIGGIFTFMLVPFVLFEIPVGILADKYSNEKVILIFGFLVITASVFIMALLESTNPVIWAMVLFLSRVGAAIIEAMRESYFFKTVDVKDIDYINFFRNIGPAGYLIGSGLGILILSFFSIQMLFLILGICLLSGIYFSGRLKKIKG
ncbi:MAG: MFS transporter [bacterium]